MSYDDDGVLASLVRCTGLTDLTLPCGFDSAQWSTLFANLTRIKKLRIGQGLGRRIETLRCFASGPIMQSLEDLTLCGLDLPPSDLSHLYGLRRLRSLALDCCFYPRLSEATIDSLSPPTSLLPALTKLIDQWRITEGSQERQGPSFEWMQTATHAVTP